MQEAEVSLVSIAKSRINSSRIKLRRLILYAELAHVFFAIIGRRNLGSVENGKIAACPTIYWSPSPYTCNFSHMHVLKRGHPSFVSQCQYTIRR